MFKPEQSAHWYHKETGSPCYEIIGKNGNARSPYVREAKQMELVPSVTTILKVIAKPWLESWKQNQILYSALTHPNPDNLPPEAFAKVIVEESKREGELAAKKGSDIHSAIETGFRTGSWVGPDVQAFMHFALKNKMASARLEQCFATDEYGGRIDFIGMFQGKKSLIDFKTKNTKGKDIEFYEDWGVQLAAYLYGYLEEDNVEQMVSIVIASDDPSKIGVKVWDDQTTYFEVFQNALQIWQWQTKWKSPGRNANPERTEPQLVAL